MEKRIEVIRESIAGTQTLACELGEGTAGGKGISLRVYRPQQRLLVGGTPMETGAVARAAMAAGYEVIVVKRSLPLSADQLDRDTAVAILYHDVDANCHSSNTHSPHRPCISVRLGAAAHMQYDARL